MHITRFWNNAQIQKDIMENNVIVFWSAKSKDNQNWLRSSMPGEKGILALIIITLIMKC